MVDQRIEGLSAILVRGDNILGAINLLSHLFSLGYRKIAAVSTEKYSTLKDRMRGYQFSMLEQGLQPDPRNLISYKVDDTELCDAPNRSRGCQRRCV
jgi:DNA-binding LacI/PurR family transcriptional regulator